MSIKFIYYDLLVEEEKEIVRELMNYYVMNLTNLYELFLHLTNSDRWNSVKKITQHDFVDFSSLSI